MLVMVECTWDGKDAREVTKRFSAWPGPPEGAKIVGAWVDMTACKAWFLHETTDVKDHGRSATDWTDLLTMEHHVVLTPEETMAITKEKGWW